MENSQNNERLDALERQLQAQGSALEAATQALESGAAERQRLADRVVELESELSVASGTTTLVDARGATLKTVPSKESPSSSSSSGPKSRSRRELLKRGGIGAAAAAAGMAALQPKAAAASGDPFILGTRNFSSDPSLLATAGNSDGDTLTVGRGVLGLSSTFPSLVAAYATASTAQSNGVYGFCAARDDDNTSTGHALVAATTTLGRSNLKLASSHPDPREHTFSHDSGELLAQLGGTLWYCVGRGTPGRWRKLAGFDTAGSFHAITPKRVWDTRFQGPIMAAGEARTVSVADGRALNSAAVDAPDLVPEGAQAIMMNLTVTNTNRAGFMAATPGGADFTASSINWHQVNSILANTTTTTLNDNREVTIHSSGTAHFIIDITGYWL